LSEERRYAFILNPHAGRGRARNLEKKLLDYLRSKKMKFGFERTREPLHATELAASASKDFDIVVAVGGDGTVHEVANGLAGSNATLGVLPVGSGNDFNRLIGMPKRFDHAIETMLTGVRKVFDTGQLTFTDGPERAVRNRRFINSLGLGLDAVVADQARRITWLRGLPLYLAAVGNTLRHLESYDLHVSLDGSSIEKRVFVLCIGNGMFEGGGFKLTPDADPHDDKFQICIIDQMSLKEALRVVPKLISGKHAEHEKVELRDARVVEVQTETPFVMHADGEILGKHVTSIRAEIQPNAMSVLVPATP